ncbi:hypothetical protein ACFOY2_05100 [Nonomuraea purpurea]|uniref:Uncharacterized protein n=1 Tax=Nonomuraea purpurea TaxID=1849276 RepID=A0ABV8FXV7_9ACTN
MAETADWPYDADRDDPLTKLRIPVVGSPWPRWHYIVAFDSGRLDDEQQHRPTDREARMLASFLEEYIHHWYNATWQYKLAERPFDVDGGANGVVFRKWGEGDWGFRRRTWSQGPTYVPTHPRIRGGKSPGPLTLVQVMDRIHTIGDEPMKRWTDWKAAHPEVFGEDNHGA